MLEESGEKAPPKARFVMRADGSHRVVLNSPIKKGLTIEDPRKPGEKPTGNVLAFLGSIDGKLESLQMKVRSLRKINSDGNDWADTAAHLAETNICRAIVAKGHGSPGRDVRAEVRKEAITSIRSRTVNLSIWGFSLSNRQRTTTIIHSFGLRNLLRPIRSA